MEHPKHMFKLMGKKITTILHYNNLLNRPYAGFYTELNIWGSLGLNFDYDGVPSLKMGVPSFYIWTFLEGFEEALVVIHVSQNIKSFSYQPVLT